MYIVKGHKGTYYLRFKKSDGKYTMITTKQTIRSKAEKFMIEYLNTTHESNV